MGLLGAPDVDWTVALEGGGADVPPGGTLRAVVSLRPGDAIEARRVMAALVGTEEYQFREREHERTGSSSRTTWGSEEAFRQEVQLAGPGLIGAGEARSLPVEIALPATAPPSFESDVLRVRWKLVAWIDVGGRDPKVEQPIVVPLTTAQLSQDDARAMGEQVQTISDGQAVGFWAQPAPMRAGQPFSGAVDVMTPLPSGARLELVLNVATQLDGGIPGATLLALAGWSSSSRNGVSDRRVLWRGVLTPGGVVGGWTRYVFAGKVPQGAVVTAPFPHGAATATLDVVISRRLRPDEHITRPVAIVTG